jgi:hypothetical protein
MRSLHPSWSVLARRLLALSLAMGAALPAASAASASASPSAAQQTTPAQPTQTPPASKPPAAPPAGAPATPPATQPSKPPAGTTPSGPRTLQPNAPPSQPAPRDPTRELMDEGQEVDGNVGEERLNERVRQRARDAAKPATEAPEGGTSSTDKAEWAVLLVSFTEEDHKQLAESARAQISQRFPELRNAYVRALGRGSAVLVGSFTGPQDPAAQAELRKVKDLGEGVPKPFARAMLTRASVAGGSGPVGPNDLRVVRRELPEGTLYTLQVAAWATLGSKEMTGSQVKRSAESYAQQLRTQGYEAFYYHDPGKELSIVTIGVFGPDAYDSRSTLFAPEVEALMRKFPKSLLNGEEVLIEVDPRLPGTKRVPQSPRLVEIPRL